MEGKRKTEEEIISSQELRSINRAQLLSLLWILMVVIILARAFYLQTYKHSYYMNIAQGQYLSKVPTGFDRGSIFFSNYKGGPTPAGVLASSYRIAIDPTQIKDVKDIYEKLSKRVILDKNIFFEKANKSDDPYEEIFKNVKEEDVIYLKSLNLKGVIFVKDSKRFYPQNETGAKVLGFVGNDGTRVRGQYGIERYYDDILSRNDSFSSINFFAELFTDIQKTIVSNEDEMKGDVVLTIDSEMERVLHQALVSTKDKWKSDSVGGIIMDPKTGAIVAMDGLQSFDPNNFSSSKDVSVYSNQMVSGVYEMGSIIKPITMASALDSGVIDEKTTYTDTGCRELATFDVCNFDKKPRGVDTSMQTILDKSLNVGIVFLVEKLGTPMFQKYFKKFGFGKETGIDLPNEVSGLTKNLEGNIFVQSATAGFGQGMAITPIQTIRALATLGNGGKLVTPYVVDSIIYKNGNVKKIAPDDGEQILKPETSERVTRMLVHVVDTALQNGANKMDHYSIAAKTGTAQIPQPGNGYYKDRYLHSFFGYFPAYDPRYIIFLFHVNPKGAEYASATLSDPFFKLVKFIISYYEIPPDR